MSVTISEEQLAPVGGGVELCYQTFGSERDEPLLLIMGLGGPMTWWDEGLCELLATAGFYVIRFDNRDMGRSTKLSGRVTYTTLAKAYAGLKVTPPYTLTDMAADSFGLLDHLGIESAHLCGISMGGMIAQEMTIIRPDRVRSLTSMMASTGRRTVGFQHPSLLPALLAKKAGREGYIEGSLRTWKMIGSPGFAAEEDRIRRRAEETYDRGLDPAGVARQMLAVVSQTDRTRRLRLLDVPTSVVHGLADKMVHVSGGRATAMAVPGSELRLIKGMGHDTPEDLWPTFVEVIRRTADRAASRHAGTA